MKEFNKASIELAIKAIDMWVPEGFHVSMHEDLLLGAYWQSTVAAYMHHDRCDEPGKPLSWFKNKYVKAHTLELVNGCWEPTKEITIDLFELVLSQAAFIARVRMESAITHGRYIVENSPTVALLKELSWYYDTTSYSNTYDPHFVIKS